MSFSPGKLDVVVELGKRLHLTRYSQSAKSTASQFCVALDKRLGNKKLRAVRQHAGDRVAVFEFDDSMLVVEQFGKGNLVLVDAEQNISQVFRSETWKDRVLKRKEKYVFPKGAGVFREDFSPVSKQDVDSKGANAAVDDFFVAIKQPESEKLRKLRVRLVAQEKALGDIEKLVLEEKEKGDALYANYEPVAEALKKNKHKFVLEL